MTLRIVNHCDDRKVDHIKVDQFFDVAVRQEIKCLVASAAAGATKKELAQ